MNMPGLLVLNAWKPGSECFSTAMGRTKGYWFFFCRARGILVLSWYRMKYGKYVTSKAHPGDGLLSTSPLPPSPMARVGT